MIFLGMFALGALLGMAGAGGAGLTITLLTVGFGVPIHTSLAVALACMSFTMISGTLSHYREGDVLVNVGLTTGLFGMIGSFTGSKFATTLKATDLTNITASLMVISSLLLFIILFHREKLDSFIAKHATKAKGIKFYFYAGAIGIITGFLSGAFGIGATAFIQIGLMLFFGISMYHAVGTTMLVILPVSIAGGIGYLTSGLLDMHVFAQTLAGLVTGAYVGAKLTRIIPKHIMKPIMCSMPITGGILLFLFR